MANHNIQKCEISLQKNCARDYTRYTSTYQAHVNICLKNELKSIPKLHGHLERIRPAFLYPSYNY